MIIHILTILFVILFWNTTITINGFNKNIVLPFSLVIVSYMVSVYILVKFLWLFSTFKNTLFNNKTKIEAAKEKCAEAMLAYIVGDTQYGVKLWQDAKKYLSQDKLFLLLSLINSKFSQDNAEASLQMLPGCSLIKEYFSAFNPNNIKDSKRNVEESSESSYSNDIYSKSQLINVIEEYKSPWAYKMLIEYHLNHNEFDEADNILKQLVKNHFALRSEWKALKARIFLKEANSMNEKEKQIKLLRKANRLDKTVAVYELAKYYKKRKELAKARKIIEDAWPVVPSIKLGKLYVELDEFDTIPIHKFQHARALCELNEDHPVSHILVATYAMESELWAIAVEYLNKFKQRYPILAFMLLARLEASKSGNNVKVWKNIEKAFVLIAQEQNLDIEGIV